MFGILFQYAELLLKLRNFGYFSIIAIIAVIGTIIRIGGRQTHILVAYNM